MGLTRKLLSVAALAAALAGLHGQSWPLASPATSFAAAPALPAIGTWGTLAALLESCTAPG